MGKQCFACHGYKNNGMAHAPGLRARGGLETEIDTFPNKYVLKVSIASEKFELEIGPIYMCCVFAN